MKINFIVPSMKAGGGVRTMINLANELSLNHEISIYSANDGGENQYFISPQIKVHKIGFLIRNKFLRVINMIYMILLNRNDICIVTGAALLPALFVCKNVYYYLQADEYCQFDDRKLIKNKFVLQFFKKLILAGYKYKNIKFFFSAEWIYKKYIEDSGRRDTQRWIINPSVDRNVFHCKDNQKRDFEKKRLTIGFIARKHPLKGLEDIIKAYNFLKGKDDVQVIYADPDHIPQETLPVVWKKVVPQNDDQMQNFYHNCDIFVSSSHWEGFGLPALEAMACGCAVITTDNGGCREYAKDRVNSIIVPPMSPEALCGAIEELLDNRIACTEIANNGINTAKEFTIMRAASKLVDIINMERKNYGL